MSIFVQQLTAEANKNNKTTKTHRQEPKYKYRIYNKYIYLSIYIHICMYNIQYSNCLLSNKCLPKCTHNLLFTKRFNTRNSYDNIVPCILYAIAKESLECAFLYIASCVTDLNYNTTAMHCHACNSYSYRGEFSPQSPPRNAYVNIYLPMPLCCS